MAGQRVCKTLIRGSNPPVASCVKETLDSGLFLYLQTLVTLERLGRVRVQLSLAQPRQRWVVSQTARVSSSGLFSKFDVMLTYLGVQ